jgi:hypothetical protein
MQTLANSFFLVVSDSRQSKTWRAPTWSWACYNARLFNSTTPARHRLCPEKVILAELDHLDVVTKPSGEILRALIRVKCKLFSATIDLSEQTHQDYPEGKWIGVMIMEESKVALQCSIWLKGVVTLTMDPKEEYNERRAVCQRVHMFFVQCCRHSGSVDAEQSLTDFAEGLLLREKPETTVGTFTLEGGEGFVKLLEEHERAERRTITLV